MASDRVKQFLAVAPIFGVGMFVAFLIGIQFGSPSPSPIPLAETPTPATAPTPTAEAPLETPTPAITPVLTDDTAKHLDAARAALQGAIHLLAKATTNNKGGYVEKARASLDAASQDLALAAAFAQAHPDDPAQPAPAPPANPAPKLNRSRAPNVAAAVDSINDAIQELRAIPGNLGGRRDTTLNDLDQAAADSVAAIDYTGRAPAP